MLPVSPEAWATVENHHLINTEAFLKENNFKKGFFNLPYLSLTTLLDDKNHMIENFFKKVGLIRVTQSWLNYNEGCKLNTVFFFAF